jgi:hypothetical protein
VRVTPPGSDLPPLLLDSDSSRSQQEIDAAGQAYFDSTYGDITADVQPMLRSIYPDLGTCTMPIYTSAPAPEFDHPTEHFTIKLGYGYVYAFLKVTSAKETSFSMISALIPNDTPRQVEWHLTGAVRNGATVEEVRAVREIALRIAIKTGVHLKHEVPDI